MKFPNTNLIHQTDTESNAKILEEKLKQTDWVFLGKCYLVGFPIFTLSLFVFLATVKLALTLF